VNTLVQVAAVSVISNVAKSSLCAYFEGVNWPLSKTLPEGAKFLNGELGDIMRQFCLVKTQVACQLLNYKKGRFMNTQVSILLNPSNLDERLREGMAMSTPEFVSLTLLRICDPDPSSYGSDFSNLCAVMKSLPSTARMYVRLLADSPDNNCFCLLVGVVESWIHDILEIFPKTSARVPNAHLEFERRKETRMRAFANEFIVEYDSSGLSCLEDVSRITFGRLGAFLHLALFMAWSHAISNNQKPPINFLADCLVGKYALPVVYCVAGWTLYSASKASSIAADKRSLFFRFAAAQTIDGCAAKSMDLSTSLVERRKWRASVYCSCKYFDFVCFIESTYLANLTLKMMIAYNDGDIISKIKLGILSHDDSRYRFSCLSGSDNKDDNHLLLVYIMERYANMRGTYFVKHLKGDSGDQLKKLASCQATRTKVAHAVVYAKTTVESDGDAFIHDDTPECQVLWKMATESVFELADKLDDSNNKK
jgi:hypothetical protein